MNTMDVRSSIEHLTNLITQYTNSPYERDLLNITFKYEFEPHGRASETFERVWYIELPTIHAHWKSTTGWKMTLNKKNMKIKSSTLEKGLLEAIQFVKYLQDQKNNA